MSTKRLVRIAFFTVLTIVGGRISFDVPIPGNPIKLSFQTLFVLLSGLVLGSYDGALAQIVYMVLGLCGVPVFSTGGGPSYLMRPSFGYIISFPLAAFVTGVCKSRCRTLQTYKLFACGLAGMAVNYCVGMAYQVLILAFYIGKGMIAALASLPSMAIFAVKDIVLLYLICLLYPRLMTTLRISNGVPALLEENPESRLSVDVPSDPDGADGEPSDGEYGSVGKGKTMPVPAPARIERRKSVSSTDSL